MFNSLVGSCTKEHNTVTTIVHRYQGVTGHTKQTKNFQIKTGEFGGKDETFPHDAQVQFFHL